MAASGFGQAWQHRRTYSNQLTGAPDSRNGHNWLVNDWPNLVELGGGKIAFVRGTKGSLRFSASGGQFIAENGAKSALEYDAGSNEFTLFQPNGATWKFHGFAPGSSAAPGGSLIRQTTASGAVTEVSAITANGDIAEITRSAMVDGTLVSEAFVNSYNLDGRLETVTLRRKEGAGAWTDISRAQYAYYGMSESGGSEGDLKSVENLSPNGAAWDSIGTTHYRYWLPGQSGGMEHGLKSVINDASFVRMSDDGHDPLSASDAVIAQYADHHFEYDAQGRVAVERLFGGADTYSYSYTASGHAKDPNNWATKAVETRPDGASVTVYSNHLGQTMLYQLKDGADQWLQYNQYDSSGRLVLRAEPSAIESFNEAAANLGVSLKANSGLIHVTEYYTANGGGAAAGHQKSQSIKNGSSGSLIPQAAWEYTSHSANGQTVYLVSKETAYRNDDGTGAINTSYSFSWHPGTLQMKERIETLPAVPASQNGNGIAATRKQVFDLDGNLTWNMDERGKITRMKFDPVTGAITQQIEDADLALHPDAPAGWSTPVGGGSNLVSDFEHDSSGRITQELGPVHIAEVAGVPTSVRRATWTVYGSEGSNKVVKVAQGFATGTAPNYSFTLVNPVSITVSTKNGKVLEQIQAKRASTSGALSSSDSFSQADYTRWSTFQYSDCCNLQSQRTYHDIPASGIGLPGTHYAETSFGYDALKRQVRLHSPGGRIERNVFDVRGQVVSSWVGTNDNGATASDPSGAGAAGNDMLILNEQQYDGGIAGGDGNLTQQTVHVDIAQTRVTNFEYDFRNRQIVVDGELDTYQATSYDNLGRATQVDRRDTTAAGKLLSRAESKFDERGRAYQSVTHGVDPVTGNLMGSQTVDTTFDQAGSPTRMEPAGQMDYQEFARDVFGRQIEITDPLGAKQLVSFDEAGNQVSRTDARGKVWTQTFDPLGRMVHSANPLGEVTTFGFNDAGEQHSVSNHLGETTTSTMDNAGRVVSMTDPLGLATTLAYDIEGNQISVTDPNNLTTISEFDFRNRLTKVTDPVDDAIQKGYNRASELIVETDAKGNDTVHTYDALGYRVSTTDRLGNVTSFEFTPLGQQASITDAESQTTTYNYNAFAQLAETIWPDHVVGSAPGSIDYGITKVEYDSLNRVLRTTDQLGDTITYNYDAAGRLVQKDYRAFADSPSGTIADSDIFTYDAAGNMLSAEKGRYSNTVGLSYDDAGRKSSESLTIYGQTYTCTSEYDGAGRLCKLIYPDGTEVVRGYTDRGELETLKVDGTTIDTRTYDNAGRMLTSTYNNGVGETRSYNDDGTLASINFTGAPVGDLAYTWDANKNKTSESISGVMSGYGFSVPSGGYDAEDRLVSYSRADGNLDQDWSLSAVGDWDNVTTDGALQSRSHGPSHELQSVDGAALSHDAKGNITLIPNSVRPNPLALTWDMDNRLSSAGTDNDGMADVTYQFDALGRRVFRDDNTTATVFIQAGQQTIADYTAGAAASSPVYNYVYASYVDEPVYRDEVGGTDDVYFHRNQQYSITALTSPSGTILERYVYSAYGVPTITGALGTTRAASSRSNRFTFTGREWDEVLALYHYRARSYEPLLGRFCSKDPIEYEDGMGLYAYVKARPLSYVDPAGLRCKLTHNYACALADELALGNQCYGGDEFEKDAVNHYFSSNLKNLRARVGYRVGPSSLDIESWASVDSYYFFDYSTGSHFELVKGLCTFSCRVNSAGNCEAQSSCNFKPNAKADSKGFLGVDVRFSEKRDGDCMVITVSGLAVIHSGGISIAPVIGRWLDLNVPEGHIGKATSEFSVRYCCDKCSK